MKKAQILIRLEESLLTLIEAKALELKTSKQQWIQDLILRELVCDIETTNSNDITDISDISTKDITDITDINVKDITNDIDILRNDISIIMEQIYQLGVNINRLDESDKNTKTEVERLGRINNGIREFALEQDERICDEVDAVKEDLEVYIGELERLKNQMTQLVRSKPEPVALEITTEFEHLEKMEKIPTSTIAEVVLGNRDKAGAIGRYFNGKRRGATEKPSTFTKTLDNLEIMGFKTHFQRDKRTGCMKLTHFTYQKPSE